MVDEIGTSVPQSRVPILCIRGFEQKGVPIWGDEISGEYYLLARILN